MSEGHSGVPRAAHGESAERKALPHEETESEEGPSPLRETR